MIHFKKITHVLAILVALTLITIGTAQLVAADEDPTAITLLYFIGSGASNGVQLEWATATEFDTFGFRIKRGDAENGPFVYLNNVGDGGFIEAEMSGTGAEYDAFDDSAVTNQTYWYILIEVESDLSENEAKKIQVQAGATATPTPAIIATATTSSQSTSIATSTSAPTRTPRPANTAVPSNTPPSTNTPQPTNTSAANQPTNTPASGGTNTPIPTNTPQNTIPTIAATSDTQPQVPNTPIPVGSNPTPTIFNFPTATLVGSNVATNTPIPPEGEGGGGGNGYTEPIPPVQPTDIPNGGGAEAAEPPIGYPVATATVGLNQPNPLATQVAYDSGTGGNSTLLPPLEGTDNGNEEDGGFNSNAVLWGGFGAAFFLLLAGIYGSIQIFNRRN
jgi:hypothetical protein